MIFSKLFAKKTVIVGLMVVGVFAFNTARPVQAETIDSQLALIQQLMQMLVSLQE
ncbi:MAG: hypothetical protein K9M10_04370 [Candidatus Pacebacteria bacterium]|nr:hypothetical protein [Candidatus Paceibacterota bacterium]